MTCDDTTRVFEQRMGLGMGIRFYFHTISRRVTQDPGACRMEPVELFFKNRTSARR